MALDIINIEPFPNGLAIAWNDNKDSFIEYKNLRDSCPCANCSGEGDIFGNTYKGAEIKLTSKAYELINVIKVGNYAISITWSDLHRDGIYTFEFLRKLDLSK